MEYLQKWPNFKRVSEVIIEKEKEKKDIFTIIGYDNDRNMFDIALSIEITN